MQHLKPPAVRPHQQRSFYVSSDLDSCTRVFVHNDAVKTPLQHPYDGPFKVIKRTNKYFMLEIKGKESTVSIDRLKPAHLEATELAPQLPDISPSTSPVPSSSPHQVTRSGRHVRWPKRLIEEPFTSSLGGSDVAVT